jgi:glycosyltransferase involved in cell wall biosynthesis
MSLSLPWQLRARRVDLLHAAYIAPPWSPVDHAFTLHCSSPFVRPELFPPLIRARLRTLIWRGLRSARHVICVSQNVLDLAVEHYGTPRDRLSVIHNGVGAHFRPVPEAERRAVAAAAGVDGPYALFAGRFEPRKNMLRVIEAFDVFRREVAPEMRLVLAGRRTWQGDAVGELIRRLDLGRHVHEIGHVPNRELPEWYAGAEMFVFPSLWEGFGLPVVEAMACGTPVVTSNLSSLPEVAGGAALLVDPNSVPAIAGAMERLHRDAALRGRLRAAGLERATAFSWRRNAEQTLALYRRLA